MADNNTIEIKFSATGDDKVVKAIDSLDRSTKKLIQAQANLTKEGKKQKNSNKAHENSVRRLEVKLQALGFSFKQAGISARMQEQGQCRQCGRHPRGRGHFARGQDRRGPVAIRGADADLRALAYHH